AKNPAILAGSRVTECDAVQELVAVAERLGAPVLSEQATAHGRLPFPSDHPLYSDCLPLWSPDVRRVLADFDVLLVVRMNLLRSYIYLEPRRPLPEQVHLVQMDTDPWQIAKNYPIDVGLLGDLKACLAEMDQILANVLPGPQTAAARARLDRFATARRAAQETLKRKIDTESPRRPMTPLTVMG